MAYTLFTRDFGIANANFEVKIWETGTAVPATVLASSTGGLVNTTGQAFLDSFGILNVYIDTARDWSVTVYDEDITEAFGSYERIKEEEILSKQGDPGVTYVLDMPPYTPYYWNGSAIIPYGGGSSIIDATPTASSVNPVQSGGVYTALQGKLDTSLTTVFSRSLLGFSNESTFKGALALEQVSNTSDADKPVSTAQAAADTAVYNNARNRANHTGTQTSATISDFTTAVDSRVQIVIGAAPGALDTLAEIADALNNDPDFAATITSELAGKAPIVHGHVAGDISGLGNSATLNVGTGAGTVAAGNDSRILQVAGKLDVAGNGSQLTGLTKAQVGLGSVDNVADADKPVSTAQAAADAAVLAAAAPIAHVGSGSTAHAVVVSGGSSGFMTGTDKAKLDTIAPGATVNSSDAALRDRGSHTGTQLASTISDLSTAVLVVAAPVSHVGAVGGAHGNAVASGSAGFMTGTDKAKLDGVAAGATANSSDAALLSRANHTGTQTASTISDFSEAVDDRVSTLLVAGTNVTLNYDDTANTLTVNSTAAGGVTDHGALTGLGDDDHTQYHTDARGDARYAPVAHVGAGGVAHSNVVAAGAAGFMTGADKTKLDGVATGATANSADATLLARANHTGTQLAATISDFNAAVTTVAAPVAHVGSGGAAHANVVAAGAAGFMTGADKTKLDGVATGATANSSDATLLARANHTGTQLAATISDFSTATLALAAPVGHVGAGGAAHANVIAGGAAGFMTGADKTKLDGVATGATANSPDATLLARANHTGTQLASTISDFSTATLVLAAPVAHVGAGGTAHADVVAAGASGFMTGADKTKLNGIATGATANSSDATLLARANHTGTQTASTISDFSEAVDDRVGALLVAGTNVTLTYNDGANSLTIDAAGGGGGVTDHGALTGLGDDDHTQYHTDARGDARYAAIAHVGAGGTAHADVVAAGASGFMTGADKTKLDGVATGATANSADATLLARANHTGTQTASTISDFSEAVDDRVGTLLVAGTDITLTYNDAANTLTITSTASGGGGGDPNTYGDAILDFGSSPGSNEATTVITGLAAIASTAKIKLWVQGDSTTVNKSANDHLYFQLFARFCSQDIVAGTGFTIKGVAIGKLNGQYRIHYSWIN